MEDVQRLQNQTMRLVTGTRLLDKKLIVELLKETGYYSVNQMTVQSSSARSLENEQGHKTYSR